MCAIERARRRLRGRVSAGRLASGRWQASERASGKRGASSNQLLHWPLVARARLRVGARDRARLVVKRTLIGFAVARTQLTHSSTLTLSVVA